MLLVNLNEKWMIPQERASFSKVISLYICIFSIFHDQVIAKIEKNWSLFKGGFFAKFLAYGIFTLTSLFLGWNNPIQWVSLKSQSEWCRTVLISQRIPRMEYPPRNCLLKWKIQQKVFTPPCSQFMIEKVRNLSEKR